MFKSDCRYPVQDFFTTSSGKRKWDDLNSAPVQETYIPQRDGVGDIGLELYSSADRTPVGKLNMDQIFVQLKHACLTVFFLGSEEYRAFCGVLVFMCFHDCRL